MGVTGHRTQILEKGSWQGVGVPLGSEELKGRMAPKDPGGSEKLLIVQL